MIVSTIYITIPLKLQGPELLRIITKFTADYCATIEGTHGNIEIAELLVITFN